MQIREEEPARTKMESLRLMCDREMSVHRQKMDSFASSFLGALDSIKTKSQETVQNQGRLLKMKSSLKEAEDELVKALAVKTRTEAKRMATTESISAIKARVEELKRILQDQKARRDEYAAIMSRESLGLAAAEEKNEQGAKWKEEIQEAISWYSRVLGLRIEGGSGVKFMFNNVDVKRPDHVYSFTIRHANDTYTLLQCDPLVDSTKELVLELNKSNDLYKFVRIMRRKFQEAAEGSLPQMVALPQESLTVSVSAPVTSVSTEISGTPTSEPEDQFQHTKVNKNVKKANPGRAAKESALSSGSASSLRRSSRFTKVTK
ncbi:kinetochore protein SPC25 homolog [Punica granatum]|uniref:Kinetochore protein SPC25 n=1 Tax=Punica granatum TaxID=22663 RepID=A0A6P8BQY7_PUNGR|nr:kinetochore protein SPC25 homolog [Punica granatum]